MATEATPAAAADVPAADTVPAPASPERAGARTQPAAGAALVRPQPRQHSGARRSTLVRRAVITADIVGFALALLVTQFAVSELEWRDIAIDALIPIGLLGWVVIGHAYGLYDRAEIGVGRSTADDIPGLILLATLATWLGLLVVNALGLAHPRLVVAATFWCLAIVLVTAARASARWLVQRKIRAREATLIVGSGQVAQRVVSKLAERPQYGLDVVGFVDDDPHQLEDGPPHLGGTRRLEQIVQAYGVERVIVAFSRLPGAAQVELLRRCAALNVRTEIVPRLFEVIGSRSQVHDLEGLPLVSLRPARLSVTARFLKRGLDVSVAGAGLVLLGPFLAVTALAIKLESPGPVFFRQERMGAGGRRFRIYKFRSMYADADERKHEVAHLNKHREQGPVMFKVAGDPRMTRTGRFLRRWSIDELPQLINVVRGEMSLVGPRPLILDEDENVRGHHRRRLPLTPGITGLWQVLGRSDIPFAEMVTLDYLYVTNWSLWLDLKLLARTIPAIISKRGAY